MIGHHIPEEDLALYAMQVLPQAEAEAIRTHLVACALCRDSLAVLRGDLAILGASVEQHPLPTGARQRFLERISASTAEGPAAPALAPGAQSRSRIVRWNVGIAWTAAALFAATAIYLGMRIDSLKQGLRNDTDRMALLTARSDQAQRVLDVLTSRSSQHALLTASRTITEPTGRAVYLADRGALIFQANNLKQLPEDKTYELWVIPINGTAPIPAGIFRPDAMGSASVVLPSIPSGVPAKAFGVTIEKAEGAASPTLPIVLSGAASGE